MEYVKYDPYNPDFDHVGFMDWIKEHILEDQFLEYTADYEDCIKVIDPIYESRMGLVNIRFPAECQLKLDNVIVPMGSYLVVLLSGKLSFILEDVMEELIFGV